MLITLTFCTQRKLGLFVLKRFVLHMKMINFFMELTRLLLLLPTLSTDYIFFSKEIISLYVKRHITA